MGILFRPARPADAEGLVGLVEELGYPTPLDGLRTRLTRLLAEPDQAVFVAVEATPAEEATAATEAAVKLRGWIHVQEFLSLASAPTGLVTGLVVDPAARRRGIGRGLLRVAEDWVRSRGLSSLRLRARTARTEAHAFYQRLGFEVAKKQLQFRKGLTP